MNNRIIDVLIEIQDQYGEMVFYNQQKTKNLMHDLSPRLQKERIHIGQFLEINGYFQLKHADNSYPIVRSRLIQSYSSTFGANESIATWVVDVFSELLGYSDFLNKSDQLVDDIKLEPEPKQKPEKKKESTVKQESEGKTKEIHVELDSEKPATTKPTTASPVATKPITETPLHTNPKATKLTTTKPITETPVPTNPKATKLTATKPTAIIPTLTKTTPARPFKLSERISADMHTAAIMPDGTVKATGPNDDGQCNVNGWRDIVAVSCGPAFTIGLKENGKVVSCGRNDHGQCNTIWWNNIISISAGARHTVALKSDGTVVATGQNKEGECDVTSWRNITHISAGYMCSYGIKTNGKPLTTGVVKQDSMAHLSNVADIVNPYPYRSLILKKNGLLDVVFPGDSLQNNIKKWKRVTQISGGPDYFAGLFRDGSVRILAYYWISNGIECNPDFWFDITCIVAGRFHLLGVKKDGSIISAMMHPDERMNKGQCKVGDWRLV